MINAKQEIESPRGTTFSEVVGKVPVAKHRNRLSLTEREKIYILSGAFGAPQNFQEVSEYRKEQREARQPKIPPQNRCEEAPTGARAEASSTAGAGTPQTPLRLCCPGNRMPPPPRTPRWILHHLMALHHQLLTQSPRWVHLIGAPLLLMQSPKLCWAGRGSCWPWSRHR